MTYQFIQTRQGSHYTLEPNSNTIVNYYSKNEIEKLYPKGEYHVIGEIGNFAKQYPKQDEILTETCKRIHIFPRGSIKKPFEWVCGYAEVDMNMYVAIVKSILPDLFYRKKRKIISL